MYRTSKDIDLGRSAAAARDPGFPATVGFTSGWTHYDVINTSLCTPGPPTLPPRVSRYRRLYLSRYRIVFCLFILGSYSIGLTVPSGAIAAMLCNWNLTTESINRETKDSEESHVAAILGLAYIRLHYMRYIYMQQRKQLSTFRLKTNER